MTWSFLDVCARGGARQPFTRIAYGVVFALKRGNGAKSFDKAVSWLQRSGETPKSLEFDHSGRCLCAVDGHPCVAEDDALTSLLKHGPPLDHFTLTVSSTRCFRKWIGAIHSPDSPSVRPWDTLRSFKLTFGDEETGELWSERDTDTPSQSIFSLLPPAITAFHLDLPGTSTAFDERWEVSSSRHASISIPANVLNKLTTFTIQCDWASSKLFPLLRQCCNVETLTIDLGCRPLDESDTTFSENFFENLGAFPIILPNVSSLHLRGTPRADILDNLKAPSLRSLDIGLYGRGVSQRKIFGWIVHKFLEASGAKDNLLGFRVSGRPISGKDLRRCLTGLHRLKRLTLDTVTWSDDLFVFEAGFIQPHLPSLEVFELLHISEYFTPPQSWGSRLL
ncbi:hypothetical protein DFP72DRAFT_558310 [Ephemerocybe angulata]|uniref:Uncharacterized protein n=1 Tax=Ephemerocybe angulata TaxID=980116 RepID=A0A8H6IEL2_9AGAR|nr:hypothetical protein DFP72DRAFT_558310 [Tulosesus angulatus]